MHAIVNMSKAIQYENIDTSYSLIYTL